MLIHILNSNFHCIHNIMINLIYFLHHQYVQLNHMLYQLFYNLKMVFLLYVNDHTLYHKNQFQINLDNNLLDVLKLNFNLLIIYHIIKVIIMHYLVSIYLVII